MDVDESFAADSVKEATKYKCFACGNEFVTRDNFMKHKKESHEAQVLTCQNFLRGECPRDAAQCWYKHLQQQSQQKQQQQQVFQKASENLFPPDQQIKLVMEALKNLSVKMESMEKRMLEIIN